LPAADAFNMTDMFSMETTFEGESMAHTDVPLANAAFLKVLFSNTEMVDVIIVIIRNRYTNVSTEEYMALSDAVLTKAHLINYDK